MWCLGVKRKVKGMKEVIGGLVRTGLAAAGGWLVSKGYIDAAGAEQLSANASAISGVAAVLGAAVWSWWAKRK